MPLYIFYSYLQVNKNKIIINSRCMSLYVSHLTQNVLTIMMFLVGECWKGYWEVIYKHILIIDLQKRLIFFFFGVHWGSKAILHLHNYLFKKHFFSKVLSYEHFLPLFQDNLFPRRKNKHLSVSARVSRSAAVTVNCLKSKTVTTTSATCVVWTSLQIRLCTPYKRSAAGGD